MKHTLQQLGNEAVTHGLHYVLSQSDEGWRSRFYNPSPPTPGWVENGSAFHEDPNAAAQDHWRKIKQPVMQRGLEAQIGRLYGEVSVTPANAQEVSACLESVESTMQQMGMEKSAMFKPIKRFRTQIAKATDEKPFDYKTIREWIKKTWYA